MTDALVEVLTRSRSLGFLGPGPVEDHIRHGLAFAEVVPSAPARALDLGAGGGLPGLVLATHRWPACRWTFLDAQTRRTAFLEEAVAELGLGQRVAVVTDRAERTGRSADQRGSYDLVVARSFGPPAVSVECAAPLLRPGGLLVVSEPPTAAADRWPTAGLAGAGCSPAQHRTVVGDPETHLVVITRTGDPIERLPRRVGVPAKRPLF